MRAIPLLALALMLAGCSTPNDSTSDPASTTPNATPTPNATTPVTTPTPPVTSTPVGTTPTPTPSSPATTTPSTPATRDVKIANFAFVESQVSVVAGSTVRWTNSDSTGHTVTADGGSFNSGGLGEGQQFSQTFSTAGSFPYACAFHPSMKGTVTVTA